MLKKRKNEITKNAQTKMNIFVKLKEHVIKTIFHFY